MTRLHAHAGAAAAAAAPSSAAPARAFPVFTPSRSMARSSRDNDDEVLGGEVLGDVEGGDEVELTAEEAAEANRAILEHEALAEADEYDALPEDDPSAFPEGSYRRERAEQILQERQEEEREMEDWDFNRDGPRSNPNPAKLFDNSAVGRIRRGLPPRPEDALQDDMGFDDDEIDAMSPESEGRDDETMADLNDEADEVDQEEPLVADGVNVFEETRIDKFGNPKKVFVDRNAKPLRRKIEYKGFEREDGEDFPSVFTNQRTLASSIVCIALHDAFVCACFTDLTRCECCCSPCAVASLLRSSRRTRWRRR